MSSATAGKRKTDADAAKGGKKMAEAKSNGPPSLFATIPDRTWEAVSAFASPPDVYQLCLTSAHFHTDPATVASDDDTNKKASGIDKTSSPKKKKSRSGSNKEESSATTKPKAVLATRLLRASLLSSLGRVLKKAESGITLKSALEMADMPEGSAIIAGSTMAATVLGEVWSGPNSWSKSDVDIFCTAKAAPQVRSVSIQSRVIECYMYMAWERLSMAFLCKLIDILI